MPTGVGYQTITGVGIESVVNTPVACTTRVRNLEFAVEEEFTHLLDDSLQGNVGRTMPVLGMRDIRGTWRCYGTYQLAQPILQHFFGDLTSGRYSFVDSLVGKSMTWAIDKQVAVWQLSGVKINQLVMAFGTDGVELSGTLIAQGITYAGGPNTTATLAALPPHTARRCKLAPDLTVRLGLASAALGSGDDLSVVDGTITLTRPMAETHVSGTRAILEQAPDNFLDGTYNLTLPRYTTQQYKTWQAGLTELSLRCFFDEEDGARTQEWLLPGVVIGATPTPVSGPGFIPQTISGPIHVSQKTYTATTISAASADNSINDSANLLPFCYPGASIFISGFTGTAGNNGLATVVSRTASKIVISGITLVTDAAGESVSLVIRDPFAQVNEA